jgi:hypothetical protein
LGALAPRSEGLIRAVLDTNVLISALLFSGPPSRLVAAWQASRFQPVLSRPILDEYLRVLAYPKFHLSAEEIRGLLDEELLPFVETVRDIPQKVRVGRDPDDAKFLECALATAAPFVVSGDADLLDLHRVGSVQIVTVAAFLKYLKRTP